MKDAEKLLELFESKCCDYDQCRDLIKKIGGCTQVIEVRHGLITTPLHEAVSFGHYDLALELIEEGGINPDVSPDGWAPVLWDLQYIDSEAEEERQAESKSKLKLIRALINKGANPNPTPDEGGEDLLHYIRFKLNEGDGDGHIWQMEHIIEAHSLGITDHFFQKLKEQSVSQILLPNWGFDLIDDDLCDCDHAVFVFEDGERIALSSYQVDDDEWDFYAIPLNWSFDPTVHRHILPNEGSLQMISLYSEDTSHYLDLSIDDAILRIHADEPSITVGVVGHFLNDKQRKRKTLF